MINKKKSNFNSMLRKMETAHIHTVQKEHNIHRFLRCVYSEMCMSATIGGSLGFMFSPRKTDAPFQDNVVKDVCIGAFLGMTFPFSVVYLGYKYLKERMK